VIEIHFVFAINRVDWTYSITTIRVLGHIIDESLISDWKREENQNGVSVLGGLSSSSGICIYSMESSSRTNFQAFLRYSSLSCKIWFSITSFSSAHPLSILLLFLARSLSQFNIPNLRVGTLDSLLALSDDLLKVCLSDFEIECLIFYIYKYSFLFYVFRMFNSIIDLSSSIFFERIMVSVMINIKMIVSFGFCYLNDVDHCIVMCFRVCWSV
jgi:hypothetical protein